MDINYYVALSLLLRIATVILPIIWVLPKQIKELRRPDYGYDQMRKGLFNSVALWIIYAAVSIPYSFTRLNDDVVLDFREITNLIISCIGFAKSLNWVLIYTVFIKGKDKTMFDRSRKE